MEWQLSSSKAIISLHEVLGSLKCQASYCTSFSCAWKLKVSHWQFEGKFDISYMSVMTWTIYFIKCLCRCKRILKSQMILSPNSTYLACGTVSNHMTCWLDLPHMCWNWAERFIKCQFFSHFICAVWCSCSNCLWIHPKWDWWRQSYVN